MRKSYQLLLFLIIVATTPLEALRRRGYKKKRMEYAQSGFILQSSAFSQNGDIPSEYTCDGLDISPPLRWENPPAGTQSFALICEDPDAVGGKAWVHWLVFNIPATVRDLRAGVDDKTIGAVEGINSWGQTKYGGPCPPLKKHRYVFTLYALKVPKLSLTSSSRRRDFKRAIKTSVLGKAVLLGRYQRPTTRPKG